MGKGCEMKIYNQVGGFSSLTNTEFHDLARLLIKAGYIVKPMKIMRPGAKARGKVPCLEITERGEPCEPEQDRLD